MNNSENVYGFCEAGCSREILSYQDYEKSLARYEEVAVGEDGLTELEAYKLYKIKPPQGEKCKMYADCDNVKVEFPILQQLEINKKPVEPLVNNPFSYSFGRHTYSAGDATLYINEEVNGIICSPSFIRIIKNFSPTKLWTNGKVYEIKHGVVSGTKDKNLPAVTEADNGKICTVLNGNLVVSTGVEIQGG